MEVNAADNISFAKMASSESGYDFLKFYIDGVEKGSWSGESSYSTVSYPVSPGQRTFKWTYSKDGSVTGGSDAAFIDDINFPSSNGSGTGTEFAVKAFAYPGALCGEGEVNLFAFIENAAATGNVLYTWTPVEMLSDPNIYNPVAWLSDTTVFTIVANQLMSTSTAEIEIPVGFKPETPVVNQTEIQLISSATEGNQWYNTAGPIEGAVNQIYVPEVSDYYHVVVTAENGCSSDPSEVLYFSMVNVTDPAQAGTLSIYPNPFRNQLHIEFGLNHQAQVHISLMNLLGQEVRTLIDASLTGNQSFTFDAKGMSPGIYFLKMETGDKTEVRKVVLSE